MKKYLPFKTKKRSVAQTAFIWQRFEEKLLFYQDVILRFSVQIFKGQQMFKELSNLNGLTKIILLGFVKSHFFINFLIVEKIEGCSQMYCSQITLSEYKTQTIKWFFFVPVEKLRIYWFKLKNHKLIP